MNRCILLLFFLISISLWGQKNTYQFKHLSTGDGLSQSSVIAIEQDRLGQMWLGTRDGLNKYDGSAFTVYRNDPKDSASISNSDILAIEEDSEGSIWIGTYNGLNRYDPVKDVFKSYFHSNTINSLTNNTVWCITEMQDGTIWAGTSDGLSIYDKTADKFTPIYPSEENETGLPSPYVLSILETNAGTVWVGTSDGLCKMEKTGNSSFSFKTFIPDDTESQCIVQDILECGPDMLCIGTKNQGMLTLDTATEEFIPTGKGNDKDVSDTDVRELIKATDGTLWMGTSNGLTLIRPNGKSQKLINNPDNPKSLAHNYIKSMFTDRKGSIWIGSYYGGVDIWDDSNTNFINYTQSSTMNGLSHNVIGAIVMDSAKNLYFGTEGKGITVFCDTTDNVDQINNEKYPELLSDNIKSLLVQQNKLWIGSFNEGAVVYDLVTKNFDQKLISSDLAEYLEKTGVYTIKRANAETVWLGTFGKGLVRYNSSSQRMAIFSTDETKEKSLTNTRVRSILVDSNTNVWAGTQRGLNLLKNKNGTYVESEIEHFFYDAEKKSGDDILALFQDSQGTVWVGIRAKGLYKYTGTGFEPAPIASEKTITSIYAILEDAQKKLWISSNQGIIKYDPTSGISTIYDQQDGLVGNEFNSGAALKVNGTKMYFGGPSGVSHFDSENLLMNRYAPQVILTDFKVKNISVSASENKGILQKSIPYTKTITLAYDKANFSIDFAFPNFINPASNRYSYRMAGLEDQWTITSQPHASYTIQNAGDYVFEVKGANNDGVWNSEPTTLHIRVEPAPWRSAWAFALYALLIAAALTGLAWIITSKSRLQHQLDLEHLESEQNQEIHTAKLQFFTNISHEFRTPLTLIAGPLQQLLQDYKGSSFMYKKLLVMESNANHLLQLINRLMDFRKFENHQFKLEAAEGNIVKFLREIFLSFTEFAKDGGYTYTFNTSNEEILVYYDRSKLEQVFYNLISNAFKYTPKNGSVSIHIKEKDNRIIIDVEDSGSGIPEQFREKVFERFFEINTYKNTKENSQQGTGIGLSIAKNIVDLHHGGIHVKPKKILGSIFRVSLPLGRKHLGAEEILKDFKFSDDIVLYTSQLKRSLWEIQLPTTDYSKDTEKETILVVEDNQPLRGFIKDLLRDKYNILEAADGREALKKALHLLPDLIVSDVIMPKMVGTELCAEIKANLKTSHIPFILLTSRTSLVYKYEGLENGADDYISKPFDLKEFQLRIKNLIDSTQRLKRKFSDTGPFAPNEMTVSSLDGDLLKKALKIVEENIGNDQFDISTFGDELGISRTLLFTKIKAWTNFTPNEFIQEIRMKRALQLLEESHLNISQVAYQVGFNSPKYFSKCFQKRFDKTPSQYQNKFHTDLADLN
ncbi:two-component regulator propeller domain-containing protein [Pricia sp.]|uniref:two-component regulator propeller domain-containing protein n=1 Tax=Pricia sp. TaxID=2268138 RepID=UPI003593C24C